MPAPSPPAGGARGLRHEALLYRNRDQLADGVAGFLDGAAQAGEPVLAILPRPTLERLDRTLRHARGRVLCRDMADVGGNPGRLLSTIGDFLADASGPARILSEGTWPGRRRAELVEVLRHEALVNDALADERLYLLCPFDAAALPAEVLEGAELTHPVVIEDGESRPSAGYGDQAALFAGGRWPQEEPHAPVTVLSFDGDLRALRHAVADDPMLAGLDDARRADAVLAVDEAATNAVRHGDGTARARLWRDGDGEHVVIELASTAPIGDPLAGRRRPPADAVSGRGLWLINQVCDLVELRSGDAGTTMRMHIG